jgi:hypothetical protein
MSLKIESCGLSSKSVFDMQTAELKDLTSAACEHDVCLFAASL